MTGRFRDDPHYFEPECVCCDDAGCPMCSEMRPVTLDDLDAINDDIAASDAQVRINQ